jgi:hypothetical protein
MHVVFSFLKMSHSLLFFEISSGALISWEDFVVVM